MRKTNGYISSTKENVIVNEVLLTYSEEEKQANEINAANANLVFSPAYIQYYPHIKRKYSLTYLETLLYGFISYYLANGSGRFYFTNEQLASILDCSPDTIKTAIKALSEKRIVEFSYKVKAGGGTIRFATRLVENTPSDGGKVTSLTVEKLPPNYNKINKNNINERGDAKASASLEYLKQIKDEDITELREHTSASPSQIREKALSLVDYCMSRGKRYKDYKAFLRNALRKDFPKRNSGPQLVRPADSLPEISEAERARNLKRLSEMRSRLRGW